MNGRHIFLDCDEVLLRTTVFHAQFLQDKYNITVQPNQYPSQWSFPDNCDLNFKLSTELFTQSDYFTAIEPMDGAQTAVSDLKKHGFVLSVVSSISDNPSVYEKRRQNLRSVFGNAFDNITLLPLGWSNKIKYYQSVPLGTVVDDSIFNIQDAIKCGHKGILIKIPHNVAHHELAAQQQIPMADSLLQCVHNHIIKQR